MKAPKTHFLLVSLLTSVLSAENVIRGHRNGGIVIADKDPITSAENPDHIDFAAIEFSRPVIAFECDAKEFECTYPEYQIRNDWKLPKFLENVERTRESKKNRRKRRRKN